MPRLENGFPNPNAIFQPSEFFNRIGPFQTLDLSAASDAKGELQSFAAGAKPLGQFPQTGHSPRNGENRSANDWIADFPAVRCDCIILSLKIRALSIAAGCGA
jgi:hypothetical protein